MLTCHSLVLLSFFALLYLAVRKYRQGDEHMWYAPVTSCAWFNQYGHAKQPPTEKINTGLLPIASEHVQRRYAPEPEKYTPKPDRRASVRRENSTRHYTRNPYPTPPKPYTTSMPRGASGSPPYNGTIADIERGGMLNPKSTSRRS